MVHRYVLCLLRGIYKPTGLHWAMPAEVTIKGYYLWIKYLFFRLLLLLKVNPPTFTNVKLLLLTEVGKNNLLKKAFHNFV